MAVLLKNTLCVGRCGGFSRGLLGMFTMVAVGFFANIGFFAQELPITQTQNALINTNGVGLNGEFFSGEFIFIRY